LRNPGNGPGRTCGVLKCFILPAGVLLEEWASGQPAFVVDAQC